ncbi:MAG: WYL domain-containing protein [candidate division WOR-3 bacterium]
MKYTSKIQRFNEFINLLKRGRYGLEELKEYLEISERTIFRYIKELKNRGITVNYDDFTKKYYIEQKEDIIHIYPAEIIFTEKELNALYFAFDFLKKKKNFPLISELESFIKKIEEYKGNIEYKSIFEITGFVFPSDLKEKYDLIKEAINEKRYIEFYYYGSKEKKEIKRKVAPWFLIHAFGKWYLIGYCTLRDEMRTFDLKKVRNINKTDELCYDAIIGKDYKEFVKDMFGPWKGEKEEWVSIFYDREVANYIKERKFFQDFKIEEFGDGSIRLKIKVSYPEAVLYYLVLPFHFHAEIESPKYLRKRLINYLERTLNKYKKEK